MPKSLYQIKQINRRIAYIDEFLAWCDLLKPNKISIHKLTDTMKANFAPMTFIDERKLVIKYIKFIKEERELLVKELNHD